MDINDIKLLMNEIKANPEMLNEIDTEIEKVLKDIIKIEKRHLYGLDSTSSSSRRSAIRDLLIEKLKSKGL